MRRRSAVRHVADSESGVELTGERDIMNRPWNPATWTTGRRRPGLDRRQLERQRLGRRRLERHLLGNEDLVVHRPDGANLVRQHLDRPYLELRRVDRSGLVRPHLVGPHLERQPLGIADLAVIRSQFTQSIRALPAGRRTRGGPRSRPAVLRDRGRLQPPGTPSPHTTAERPLIFSGYSRRSSVGLRRRRVGSTTTSAAGVAVTRLPRPTPGGSGVLRFTAQICPGLGCCLCPSGDWLWDAASSRTRTQESVRPAFGDGWR